MRSGVTSLYFDESINNGIVCGIAFQGVFFHPNADIADSLIIGRSELTLGRRCDSQPVPGGKRNLFPINHRNTLPGENPVNLLVVLVRMHKRNTCASRKMIDDGLAYRHDYQEMPPKVEYGLTDLGKEMLPIVDALANFGRYYKSIADELNSDR